MARTYSNPNWVHILSQVDEDRRIGFCQKCDKFVELHKTSPKHPDTGKWRCIHSRNEGQNRRRRVNNDFRLKRGFRRTGKLSEYCEICGVTENLRYDHNHETKEFRGTLCHHCNAGLGFFKDSPDIMAKAVEYLIKRGNYHVG